MTEINETLLDVLIYLFRHYIGRDGATSINQQGLVADLQRAGFRQEEVESAVGVLESLRFALQATVLRQKPQSWRAVRVYTPEEIEKIDLICRGFLVFLELLDILDPISREWVIEHAMSLQTDIIDMDQLKWIIVMVLMNDLSKENYFVPFLRIPTDGVADRLH